MLPRTLRYSLAACAALAFAALGFTGCNDLSSGMGRLQVNMTDAPGDYQQVNVQITQVAVHRVSADSASASDSGSEPRM